MLGHHPDRTLVPGVEIASGSLGHGLPLAVGIALGLRGAGAPQSRAGVVLVGDGELDEGCNHEAIAFAGRRGLDALNVVVVDNASATYGWRGGARPGSPPRAGPRPASTGATTRRWSRPHPPHPGPPARRRGVEMKYS